MTYDMSKGLGRIEREILKGIDRSRARSGCVVLGSSGLANTCFKDYTIAARKAVVRSMHTFVRKYPQYALMGGNGRKSLVLYEPSDPKSVEWATSITSFRDKGILGAVCTVMGNGTASNDTVCLFGGYFRDGAGHYNDLPRCFVNILFSIDDEVSRSSHPDRKWKKIAAGLGLPSKSFRNLQH